VNEEESDESELQGTETNRADGVMACPGGCKGTWSRYNFDELDWNNDSLAEDGQWHTFSSLFVTYLLISNFVFSLSGRAFTM